MVHLVLSSSKGNQGLRYFPYSGYLGLTPIRVEGFVKTRLDADSKLLQAKSLTISIRCYESRVGRVNTLQSNVLVDHTQTLWSKSPTSDFEPIGNLEFPFRLSLPAKINGFSTAVFVDYRCTWRVEAVLTHIPISGVGSRQVKHFELPLIRYDLPPYLPPSSDPLLSQITNKPRAPRIQYSFNPPTAPVGPLDLVPILLHLRPIDDGVSIRGANVVIERRIQLHDGVSPTPPVSPTLPAHAESNLLSPLQTSHPNSNVLASLSYSPTQSYQESTHPGLVSTSSLASSDPTITPHTHYPSTNSLVSETRPLLSNPTSTSQPPSPQPPPQSSPSHSKLVVNPIAGTDSSGRFSLDTSGVWSKTLTLQWPASKTHSRWAIGETIHSELVSVTFLVRVKIVVSSQSGSETIELAEKEIIVVSTNDAERQLSRSKYSDMLNGSASVDHSGRSKSKSPRRPRSSREETVQTKSLPPGAFERIDRHAMQKSTSSSSAATPSKSKSSSRRPHTSAGPRDKTFDFAGSSYTRTREPEVESNSGTSTGEGRTAQDFFRKRRTDAVGRSRPDTGASEVKRSVRNGFFSGAPRIGNALSGSSSTTASSSSISSSSQGDLSDHMREWEEELAKIEMRSRRSSDLVGFAGKRKRSAGPPKVVLPGEMTEIQA